MKFDYREIVPYMLEWFDYNARFLPWREEPTPYYVWISEIMLQQTRVEAVKPYFDRFIQAIPDIASLATAEEEKLLKLWQGLGYYNRVRNLQSAAKQIMEEHSGRVPPDYNLLLKLPGIGPYTAGAIASIAYQIPVPAIDGNVLRVTKRMEGSFDDISKDAVKKALWQELIKIIPGDRPGDFNQSLMELGATLCIPNGRPYCEQCPVMHLCRAFHNDTAMEIPVKPGKKERRKEDRTILVLDYQSKYAVHKRPTKGLLAGLWEFPNVEGFLGIEELMDILKQWGVEVLDIKSIGKAKHIFSHVEWNMLGYHIIVNQAPPQIMGGKTYVWAEIEEMTHKYSIPSAFSTYTQIIVDKKA